MGIAVLLVLPVCGLCDAELRTRIELAGTQSGDERGGAASTEYVSAAGTTSDVIELLSGSKLQGNVTARDSEYITIQVTMGGRTYSRKYPVSRIQAVTIGGRREVLHAMPGGGGPSPEGPPGGVAAIASPQRTPAQVEALIDSLGRSRPHWWDSVPLSYPRTLDLSWPQRPPGNWNNQRNIGQYIWDVINPNTGKWREGIRLMHHLLVLHQDNPATRARAMESLGRMYKDFEQDYARAAFWWRQAEVDGARQSPAGVKLAECYWRLGNRQMAEELLNKLPIYSTSIKLWADMGETDKSLQLAERLARAGWPDLAYLLAGDACRIAGRYRDAVEYYQKVLAVPARGRGGKRILLSHQRARANIEGIRAFDALDLSRVPDGTYRGSSPGYAGDVHVEVAVKGGRIESVEVTAYKEKQFYSALTDTPRQIVQKQGLKGVDAVTGATVTSEAIINAVARALARRAR